MPNTLLFLAALAGAGIAAGQSAAPLSFEVASFKPAAPCCAPGQWRESKVFDDRIDFRYVTLRYCVAFAYGLKEYQVSGPPWTNEVRYDILAKGPAGTRKDQLPAMMQALLAERLKVEVRREKKEFSVYALVPAKTGPKLKDAPPAPNPNAGAAFGISMSGVGVGRLEAKNANMTSLANTLPRFVGRPVVDLTGLAGRYDFELEFSPEDMKGMPVQQFPDAPPGSAAQFGMSIFSSIQRIGLRLESQKLPLDAVVVERAERTPVEN